MIQLKHAMDADYQAQQAALQDVVRQEADLRRALAELEELRVEARTMPADQLAAPRAIGADLLWQGWTQRTRQDLNVKLALILVQKAEKMSALRYAFGRAEAVNNLIAQEKTARRKAAQGREVERNQYLALLKGATSAGAQTR
jgi:hypothetical protein